MVGILILDAQLQPVLSRRPGPRPHRRAVDAPDRPRAALRPEALHRPTGGPSGDRADAARRAAALAGGRRADRAPTARPARGVDGLRADRARRRPAPGALGALSLGNAGAR